jgi:hypothetical protein
MVKFRALTRIFKDLPVKTLEDMGLCQSRTEKQRKSRQTITCECIRKPTDFAIQYLKEHFPSHKIILLGPNYPKDENEELELSTVFVFTDELDEVIAVKFNS